MAQHLHHPPGEFVRLKFLVQKPFVGRLGMKARTTVVALVVAFVVAGLAAVSEAAVVSVSATAPTVDGADIAQLVGNRDAGGDSGHLWSNRPWHGQSFTTGSHPAGYGLNAVTLKNRNSNTGGSGSWNVRVGSIDGSDVLNLVTNQNIDGSGVGMSANTFVTWTLDGPITLSPSTLYGFDVHPDGSGFITANADSGDLNPYSGGTAFSSGDNLPTSPPNPLTIGNFDRVFHVDLTAIGPQIHEIGGDNTIGTLELAGAEQNTLTGPLTGAKTIRLVQNLSEHMHFAEIEAWETTTGINQALATNGGVATAKDTGSWGGPPDLVIDGNTSGTSGSEWWHSGSESSWIQVELASPTALDSVHVWGRTDCCGGRLDDFNLVIRDELGAVLYDESVLGLGSDPGIHRDIPVNMLVYGELLATLDDQTTYVFELPSSPTWDQLAVINPNPDIWTTILDVNDATLEVQLLGGSYNPGETWQLLVADEILGSFSEIILPRTPSGLGWDTTRLLEDGTISVVPEPSTLALLGLSLVGIVRRRRSSS